MSSSYHPVRASLSHRWRTPTISCGAQRRQLHAVVGLRIGTVNVPCP
jgi:hypothetical protein